MGRCVHLLQRKVFSERKPVCYYVHFSAYQCKIPLGKTKAKVLGPGFRKNIAILYYSFTSGGKISGTSAECRMVNSKRELIK